MDFDKGKKKNKKRWIGAETREDGTRKNAQHLKKKNTNEKKKSSLSVTMKTHPSGCGSSYRGVSLSSLTDKNCHLRMKRRRKKKTMDDAPLSLYGIPLYINILQVMLDDGAVHTALCKRRDRALPPGPAQQLLYSIYSPAQSLFDSNTQQLLGSTKRQLSRGLPIPQNKKKK